MNVYSAFSGSDIGYLVLKELGIDLKNYYSSEIDPGAIQVSKNNFKDIQHIGDMARIDLKKLKHINLMTAGSPCQGFSRNGKGLNFDDPRSGLFFEWNKQRLKLSPDFFFLENVQMKKECEQIITETLGVDPIHTNGGDYSAQKRPRTFWTNIPQVKHDKQNTKLIDILEILANPVARLTDDEKNLFEFLPNGTLKVRNATKQGYLIANQGDSINLSFPKSKTRRGRVAKQKANTLDRQCNQAIFIDGGVRKFSIIELERLQGYPDNFTSGVPITQRKSIIGNGWNKEQIKPLHLGLV